MQRKEKEITFFTLNKNIFDQSVILFLAHMCLFSSPQIKTSGTIFSMFILWPRNTLLKYIGRLGQTQ